MLRDKARLLVCCGIGLIAGLVPVICHYAGQTHTDFDQAWLAARAIWHGKNPYGAVAHGFLWPLFYPLTVGVVALPFAALAKLWAAALWTAVSFGVLSYALTSEAWWPLIGLLSYPAVDAARLAQWSPILTAIGLLPALSWIAVASPTTGGAIALAFLPRTFAWRSVAIGVAIVVAAFVVDPSWPAEWRSALATARHFVPLVARPGGAVLLLALIRWRRTEARLLALLALVPQTAYPYEALPLILALGSRREALLWSCSTCLGAAFLVTAPVAFVDELRHNAPVLLATCYLPILVMVMRRPNIASRAELRWFHASRAETASAGDQSS